MNVNSYKSRLMAVTKDLAVQWEQTKESWRDSKALEFERQYLVELQAAVDRAATVIDEVDELLIKIKSDCE